MRLPILMSVLTLFLLGIGVFIGFKLYNDQQELKKMLLVQPEQSIVVSSPLERHVTVHSSWGLLEDKVRNTVPQIFVNKAIVDLLQPQRPAEQYQSVGTCFFINDQGELVTNAHVVDQARSMWIQIPHFGKEQFDIELVGISHDRDLALVRLKPEGLKRIKEELKEVPYLILGNSDLVHRADEIMALGYPLGQQGLKSTTGVVSGREKHLIQISAPINPGNSGGPSVNLKGEVIGINTAGVTEAQNVGYIIPINELKIILDDLRTIKVLRKPFMGVFFQNLLDDTVTNYLGNPVPGGLFVVDVYKNSPMHKVGIKKHDMIYEINGLRIDIHGELLANGDKISLIDYIAQLKLGQEVNLVVYRAGKRTEIKFNFYQADLLPIHKVNPGYEPLDYEIMGGIVIQPLTLNLLALLVNICPGLTKYAEMQSQVDPVLIITHVFLDSYIFRCRTIMPGNIITKINNTEVKTLDDVRTALFKSFETGKVIIETAESFFMVLPFEKIIEEEKRISNDNFYTITPGMKAVIDKLNQEQSKKDN